MKIHIKRENSHLCESLIRDDSFLNGLFLIILSFSLIITLKHDYDERNGTKEENDILFNG